MRADRSLRLPAQIGTSALLSLARGSLFAVPGIILFTVAVVIILWLPDLGDASGYIFLVIGAPGFVTCGFAFKHLKRALAERPSDLLVARDGFTIDGGPHHRTKITWDDLTGVSVVHPTRPDKGSDDEDNSDQTIVRVIYAAGGTLKTIELGAAERLGEKQSLEELAATLEAAKVPDSGAKPTLEAVNLLTCDGCSAALVPTDAATLVCPYCSHVVTVPQALRTQIRDAVAVQSRPDKAIAKLLVQPGATLVGALFVVAAAFMLVAWPVAIIAMGLEYARGTLTFPHVMFLIGFVASSVLGFYGLIRTRLVDRQALRLLAMEFAAVEPAKPGEPYRCQRCLAPLPALADDKIVARCVYCGADNVLGIQIGREASIAREESQSLDRALARRRHEHRVWRGFTIVALGLLVLSWFSLRYGIGAR